MNRLLHHTAFAVGLLALGWIGAGYVPGHLLALSLVLLIAAFYLMGALELRRFHTGTEELSRAVAGASEAPADLGAWLASVPAGLRHAVRLRVEGERVGLPGPALTPYLAGLLVLLGMLGTFLGMVVTLNGTGLALESATNVEAIRASLAAPVRGLGLAFGCSVAGVAASAMLGLMSALARRERQQVVQQLDARVTTTLRGFSRVHQREESLALLRAQAETLPAVVTQLQALVGHIERQGQALHDQLVAGQAKFHDEAQRAYTGLAESVDRSLKSSLAESARLAGAAIEPAVTATMAGLATEAGTLRDTLSATVRQQLDGVAARLDTTVASLATQWQAALASQQRQGEAVAADLQAGLDRFSTAFEQRATALVDGVSDRMDRSADTWTESLGRALAEQRQGHEALTAHGRDAAASMVAGFETHAASLLRRVAESQAEADAAAVRREQERSTAFHDGIARLTAAMQRQAEDDGAALAERQRQICATLEQTAQAIAAQTEIHARATIGEIARLVEAASEAPRAAAEVIGELRTALSDSLVRDNAALDERNRLMSTLSGLLDAVNHASTEQRTAIDALVATTTDVLERAGTRFAESVETESRALQAVSEQVTGSAAEVANLGEGFGVAVQQFSRASEDLMAQLQRIEGALSHTMARSDEQLAYYVAQAREIVDLTLGSHQQLFEGLQSRAKAPEAESA